MASVEGQDERVGTRPGPRELLDRAIALRPLLIEQSAETEARRYYSDEIHRAFEDAGFYRSLIPHRYGGLELDMANWLRLIAELARGCPSSGVVPRAWPPATRCRSPPSWRSARRTRSSATGTSAAASVAAPTGTAVKRSTAAGRSPAQVRRTPRARRTRRTTWARPSSDDERRPAADAALRRAAQRVGDARRLGRPARPAAARARTACASRTRRPRRDWALEDTLLVDVDVSGGTPGSRLHGNPMYAGRRFAVFQLELAALMIGAAKGALDEYEAIVATKRTQRPPMVIRAEDPDYQRWFGMAIGKLATAEAAMLNGADQWTRSSCRRNVEEDAGFSREDDMVLDCIAREGMRMAWDAMQEHICPHRRLQRAARRRAPAAHLPRHDDGSRALREPLRGRRGAADRPVPPGRRRRRLS